MTNSKPQYWLYKISIKRRGFETTTTKISWRVPKWYWDRSNSAYKEIRNG